MSNTAENTLNTSTAAATRTYLLANKFIIIFTKVYTYTHQKTIEMLPLVFK